MSMSFTSSINNYPVKKILVIDDCELIRAIIIDFLKFENFDGISAENGLIGLHLANELKPDLILCDINMPEMDGLTVLKKLRQNLATAKIPFVFLTSAIDAESRTQAWQLGANGYLIKPVQIRELYMAITTQLGYANSTLTASSLVANPTH